MAKNNYLRIQLQLKPKTKPEDARILAALESCPLNRAALLRFLLLRDLFGSQGNHMLLQENLSDTLKFIAEIYPKAANQDHRKQRPKEDLSGKSEPFDSTSTPNDASDEKNTTTPESQVSVAKDVEDSPQCTITKAPPTHQWSAQNLPPCMDMSDFLIEDFTIVDGKKRL